MRISIRVLDGSDQTSRGVVIHILHFLRYRSTLRRAFTTARFDPKTQMTFLNPLALIGLVAAAIPILLHLFNLRKLRTIEFSSLTYIKELQRTKIRKLKLRQFLLLFLRTLLVILIVLAFARPTIRLERSGLAGTRAAATAMIIIDDSQSMTDIDEHGEYMKQARQIAATLLDLLNDGDEVSLLPLSRTMMTGDSATQQPRTKSFTARQLEELRPSLVRGTLAEALQKSSQLFSSSPHIQKELYIISDLQKGLLEGDRLMPTASISHDDVTVFVIPVGSNRIRNLGIERLWTENIMIEPGREITLIARIVNESDRPVDNHVVSLFVQGTRIAQRALDIPAGASADVTFAFTPSQSGFLEGWVEVEDDDLAFDNRRSFAWRLPDAIRTLLVGSESDLRYLRLALATRLGTATSIDVRTTPSRLLSASLLSKTDVVVLVDPDRLSETQLLSLRSFAESGGGLMYFPGPGTDIATYNSTIAAAFQLPQVDRMETRSPVPSSRLDSPPVEFKRVSLQHPLFEGMFQRSVPEQRGPRREDAEPPRLVSPVITKHLRYRSSPQAFPVIPLTDGSTFLLEQQFGSGRILVFATSADMSWSDFPGQSLFVPLIRQSVSYLSRSRVQRYDGIAGEEFVLHDLPSQAEFAVIKGDAALERVIPAALDRRGRKLQFSLDDQLGIFTVEVGSTPFAKISVNMDPRESRVRRGDEARLLRILEEHGIDGSAVTTIADVSSLQRKVTESRYGTELWNVFLIAALAVAVIEMLVARSGRRETEQLLQPSTE